MCYIVVLWNHVQTLSICKGLGSEARHLRSHSGRAFQDEDLRAVVHQENWSKRSCAIFDIIFINFRRCSMYSCTFPLEYFIFFNYNICLHLSQVNSSTSLPSCGFRIGIGDLGEVGNVVERRIAGPRSATWVKSFKNLKEGARFLDEFPAGRNTLHQRHNPQNRKKWAMCQSSRKRYREGHYMSLWFG